MKALHVPLRLALALACATSVAPGLAQSSTDPLVHLAVHEAPVENGKTLDMRFDELERTDTSSLVEVVMVSGGSVSSSMFVMRGMCAVAEARHAAFFLTRPVEGPTTRYRVTFPTDASGPTFDLPRRPGEPRRTMSETISVQQCRLVGF